MTSLRLGIQYILNVAPQNNGEGGLFAMMFQKNVSVLRKKQPAFLFKPACI